MFRDAGVWKYMDTEEVERYTMRYNPIQAYNRLREI